MDGAAMAYLIDGHNLIAHMPDLSLADPNDEVKLVQRLKGYMMRRRKKCTVVFDNGLPGGTNPHLSNSQVEVVWARSGSEADRVLQERIRAARTPAQWQVVTSDQKVAHQAQQRGMRVINSADFAGELAAASAPAAPDDEDPNPVVPPREVEEMLRLFGERKPRRRPF